LHVKKIKGKKKTKNKKKKTIKICMHGKKEELETYLIPWPGPHVISVASTFLDPPTIEIQSSPSINKI
jgi:hypothetical protein